MIRFRIASTLCAIAALLVTACSGGSHSLLPQSGGKSPAKTLLVDATQLQIVSPLQLVVDKSGAHFSLSGTVHCHGKASGHGEGANDNDDNPYTPSTAQTAAITAFSLDNPCVPGGRVPQVALKTNAAPVPNASPYYIVMQTQGTTSAIAGPGTTSGTSIAFPPANAPLKLSANQTYTFALAQSATTMPTPTPAPACPTYAANNAITPPASLTTAQGSPQAGFMSFKTTLDGTQYAGVYQMQCGPQKKLWYVSLSPGISSYDPSTGTIAHIALPSTVYSSYTIGSDSSGNLYSDNIYVSPAQVVQYNLNTSAATLFPISAPAGSAVPDFYVTGADGYVYAGMHGAPGTEYMVQIQPGGAMTFHAFPLGCDGATNGFLAPDGTMWISDRKCGFVQFNPSTNTFVTHPITPSNTPMTELAMGPDGAIYGATYPYNNNLSTYLERLDPVSNTISQYALPPEINGVDGIVTGSDGNLWLSADAVKIQQFGCCQQMIWTGGDLVRLNVSTGVMTEYSTTVVGVNSGSGYNSGSAPGVLMIGPDGRIYGISGAQRNIATIDPALAGP